MYYKYALLKDSLIMNNSINKEINNKWINNIKRNANLISNSDDVGITEDIYLDISRKIFLESYGSKLHERGISIYSLPNHKHQQYPEIEVKPHLARDDGIMIFFQLVRNNTYLKLLNEALIHVTLQTVKSSTAYVYTITLDNDSPLDIFQLPKTKSIVKKIYQFSQEISDNYLKSIANKLSTSKRRKLSNNSTKLSDSRQNINAESNFVFNSDDWVSASKTRNYILKDPLVDWLDRYQSNKIDKSLSSSESCDLTFPKFIMEKGIEFENKIVELLKSKVESSKFVTICNDIKNCFNNIKEYEKRTKDEIMKGTPIIYQGLLMNHVGSIEHTYGFPDLIVRSDYVKYIINSSPIDQKYEKYPAAHLNKDYHYVIIDIKYTTLELCCDGIRIRNSGSIPAYKSQLYIYNHALGIIQGYEPRMAYILGRRYKYINKNKTYYSNDCFDRLGCIDYNGWDKNYINLTIKAVNWIKDLRRDGKEWKLLPKPSRKELYPNMSNLFDGKWSSFKHNYANDLGEITLLWNCGPKNREIAHSAGIYSFRDKRCTASMIGIRGEKQAPILNEIIRINNKVKFDDPLDRIIIKKQLSSNKLIQTLSWSTNTKLRLTVDFEMINCVFDDFKQLPRAQDENYLFMIGIGYSINEEKPSYKMFIISELSISAEMEMIRQFYNFLRTLTNEHLGMDSEIPILYHWGSIESSFFRSLCQKLRQKLSMNRLDDNETILNNANKLKWFDLCQNFKDNLIVINGCFGFGLKEISARLNDLNLITTNWGNSDCMNGSTAMLMAKKEYDKSNVTGIPITKSRMMYEIMLYNRIDCLVIHDIIQLIRKKLSNL